MRRKFSAIWTAFKQSLGTPKWTFAHYAALVSTVGFFVSLSGLYVSKLAYDISERKELREINEKRPAIDVQIVPSGASSGTATVSIINRGDVNILPQDITILPSLEAGEFYFASDHQSIDDLKSSLSLLPMGPIAPKATARLKATLSGPTDGKNDAFKSGVELQFVIRIRFGDAKDTTETFAVVRNVNR